MSSKKYKGLHGLKPWQNSNYIATTQGQRDYDREVAKLQEARRRLDSYYKLKAAEQREKESKKSHE